MPRLSDILAQPTAIATLRAALSADRLPHALLFAGPTGVGKGTTADALSQLFLCEKPNLSPANADACGACAPCQLMAAGTHSDFHRVYRQLIRLSKDSVARDLGVDVIREFLLIPAAHSSQLGRGKVFIVEEADRMSTSAQNALLKTLEEPHGRTLIILLAETPGALLPTIRSRCQPIRFAPLPDDVIRAELTRRGIAADQAATAAKLAAGSLGQALRFVGDGLLPIAHELEQRLTAAITGRGAEDLPKFLKTAGDALVEKELERDPEASKDQASRESLVLLLRLGADSCRRLLRIARTPNGMDKLCHAVDRLTAAEQLLEANVNVTLILQQLAAELEGSHA